jgi:hypothetical protein
MRRILETPTVGFTSDKIVMLDLDRMDYNNAVKICQYILKRWNLGGFILPRSSRGNYHAVFDRYTNWKKVIQLLFTIAHNRSWKGGKFNKKESFTRWAIMQAIEGSCTLRISKKGKKAPPQVIARAGTQNRAIRDYLYIRDYPRMKLKKNANW